MSETCCGHKTNVAYIFKGRSGKGGRWKSVGRYCTRCGKFWNVKRVRLREGARVGETVR